MDCHNGSHQYSETEVATTELQGETKHDAYVDFVDNESVSVQNEICRGNKLRNEKPRHNETVLNIASLGPYVKQHHVRKGHLQSSNNNKRPNTLKCPCARPNSVASSYKMYSRFSKTNFVQTKAKKGKRCPLRIAELAVPSKRQCIETWREKSDILPGFMVERLKQQVMDQIPIAKIPEAIYCFRNEKRVSSKNSSFRWLSDKQIQYETQKPSRHMDERMLCILFAHKISQRLSRPLKLTLEADLEKLNKLVFNDIAKMMYKSPSRIDKQDIAILIDVSNKVTFWITGILEDSYLKVLEDDLRAKEKTEALKQIVLELSKPLVTIAETVLQLENVMKSKDLEEEEGPVLDFIDDVVDNVIKVCEPQLLRIDSSTSCSSDSKQHTVSPEESEKSLDIRDIEMTKDKESTQDLAAEADDAVIDSSKDYSNSEYFRNEISKIINKITEESGDNMSNRLRNYKEEDSRNNTENEDISLTSKIKHDINDRDKQEVSPIEEMEHNIDIPTSNTGISLDTGTEHDLYDGNKEEVPTVVAEMEHDIDIRMNDTGISLETGIEHNTSDESLDKISESSPKVASDNVDVTHSNVSERFPIVNDDFKTDLVTADNFMEKVKTSTTEENKFNQNKHTRWNSYSKSNIIFAEPNQDLLINPGDADEIWPADFGDRPILKVSDSASKSISSLGRINEQFENIMQSQQEEDENSIVSKGKVDINAVNKILDHMLSTGKVETASEDPLTKVSIDTSTTHTAVKQLRSKSLHEEEMRNSINLPETNHEKRVDKSFKLESSQMASEKSERERSTADTNEDDKICDDKIRQKNILGWKVHLKTAPAWVHAWGQGRGEPSEDSVPIQKRPTKVTESELRIWCKDLEKAFINLETWSNWISATCKESLFILKQKKLTCPCLANRGAMNWRTLKKKVHKDTLLWTKLHQRTDENFKTLKRKYNNVEYSKSTPISNRTIFETMGVFEEFRVKVHEMIVAAEYQTMCTCVKTKTTDHLNKEYRGYRTERKDTTCPNNNNKN